ncbi:MAG: DUF4294 domain-containing protein [Bacteroidales bacterium]|nr:DUF4294 domain-containing protein [Bacteroidales bacterium]MDD3891372.1 DUF4294 domain-containing protein [Bacteroidales bacterium]
MRQKIIILLITVCFAFVFSSLKAQRTTVIDGYKVYPTRIVDGDTLANVLIPQIVVFPERKFASKRDYRNYRRLIHNLKVVYPYAQIAKYKIAEMDVNYRSLETDKDRKKYVKQVEKELKDEFESQLVKLTFTQGRLLIKLIDREVGRTTYAVIRDLKGGFSAVFWQTLARLFGSNLKTEFEAMGDDKLLNELIILYEHGLL